MKILAINSSPRKIGNTQTLVDAALKGAAEAGAQTESIFLSDYTIKSCTGCFRCTAEGDCPLEDDMLTIKEMINNADGIILASPTYVTTCNAVMMNLIERFGLFEFMTSESFSGKYIAAITTAGSNTGRTLKSLTTIPSVFKRHYISARYALSVGRMTAAENPDALAYCHNIGQKLVSDINEKKTFPLQGIPRRIINRILIQPNLKKIIIKQREGRLKAVYDFHKNTGTF